MKLYSCLFCKKDISCNDYIFHRICNSFQSECFCLLIGIHDTPFYHMNILAVCKDSDSACCRSSHSFSVKRCVHHRLPILTDRMASCLRHSFDISQFFSCLTDCDCTKLDHMHRRIFLRTRMYIFHTLFCVDDRFCVRHRTDRCHTSVRCCLSACL